MGVVSRRWVWIVGVVVKRYIDFLILLIPIYSSCICSFLQEHPTSCSFFFFFPPYFIYSKRLISNKTA